MVPSFLVERTADRRPQWAGWFWLLIVGCNIRTASHA